MPVNKKSHRSTQIHIPTPVSRPKWTFTYGSFRPAAGNAIVNIISSEITHLFQWFTKKELSSEFSLESGTHKREKGRCTSFRGLLGSAQVVASSSYSGIVLLARQNSLSRGVCAAAHRHICALPERRCILAIREPLEHPHLPALEIYGRPWRF